MRHELLQPSLSVSVRRDECHDVVLETTGNLVLNEELVKRGLARSTLLSSIPDGDSGNSMS